MNIRSLQSLVGGVAVIATAVGGFLLSQPSGAQAQVAAKVESQTRPNFGVLLDPPTRSRNRSRSGHRRWDYGRHRPDWRSNQPPVRPLGGEEVVLIDCGGNPGTTALEDAVRRVRPGGTLIIRARGGACVGWLNIDRPITVIGDAGFDVRDWDRRTEATIQAPDGFPCVTVAQGVRAEFRDIIFASPHAGDAACIVSYGGQIELSRVGFRHAGDEPVIYADGGLVDIRSARMDADTISAAIVADGATLQTDELMINGSQSGIEVTTGEGPPSRINRTRLIGTERPNTFGPRAIGVLIQASRGYGEVIISNSKICGYPEGVAVEGAVVKIDHTRICKAEKGVTVYNGEVLVDTSRIVADSVGVLVIAGNATVKNNIFAGVYQPTYDEIRGTVIPENNHVWSSSWSGCQPAFRPRYGNRYEPAWNSQAVEGFTCHNNPYPQDWWSRDEEDLGVPYASRVSWPLEYDRFRRGQGWYDCQSRYVNDDRYPGEDRWSRGPMGWTDQCRRRPGEPQYAVGAYGRGGVYAGDYQIDFDTGFDFGL